MILTDVSDIIHADSLALFALNIEILLADVTKPEKSKILTLAWPVTSSVTSGSNFWPCTGSSRTGLSNGVWNLEIGPVVWEISGGGPLAPPPPPAGRVTNQTPAGRGLRTGDMISEAQIFIRVKMHGREVGTWEAEPFLSFFFFLLGPTFLVSTLLHTDCLFYFEYFSLILRLFQWATSYFWSFQDVLNWK